MYIFLETKFQYVNLEDTNNIMIIGILLQNFVFTFSLSPVCIFLYLLRPAALENGFVYYFGNDNFFLQLLFALLASWVFLNKTFAINFYMLVIFGAEYFIKTWLEFLK